MHDRTLTPWSGTRALIEHGRDRYLDKQLGKATPPRAANSDVRRSMNRRVCLSQSLQLALVDCWRCRGWWVRNF